jgi:hypothetical protein
MNYQPNHERGILRRQIKDDVINHFRSHRGDGQLTIDALFITALGCRLRSTGQMHLSAEQAAEQVCGKNAGSYQLVMEAMNNLPRLVQRAAVSPAMTSVATWAAELINVENFPGLLPAMTPASVYTALASRGLRLSFDSRGTVRVPGRLPSQLLAGDFIGEGAPIPANKLSLIAQGVGPPKKMAVLSSFTEEMRDQSTPSIEAVLRQAIAEDTGLTLDARLLDAVAGSAIRPPGLLNGVTPITATTGGGLAALSGDLGALAASIPNATDLVYLMNQADRVRALTLAPGLQSVSIILAAGLAPKAVIALDAADFISGENDAPAFDFSDQATIHNDSVPLPIATTGSPNVMAAPSLSAFQQDLVVLRMLWWLVWAMRRSGRVASVASVTW